MVLFLSNTLREIIMLDKIISLMGVVGWLAYLVAVQYGMVAEMPYCVAALVTFVLPMRLTYVFWFTTQKT